ncbi:MAG: CoA transferase [Deltaproteobacteria bacterium]|nr:CoA transferase [Deltaproteobacteria bacterium]
MAEEVKKVEIKSRADTFPLMAPEVRPWPVTPPPSQEEVMKNVYAKRKAEEFGKWCEDNLRMEYNFNKPEALQGLVVLEVGLWRLSHGFAASLLAELGAETIKVEPPEGDPLRQLTPFGREEYMISDSESGEPCGLEFIHEMRNKYSVTLNLETEEGRKLYQGLAMTADVIIEGYPPGYMDERGIGYRQLSKRNPKLVYCWTGEVGQWGPMKDKVSKFGQWMLDPFGMAACSFIHNTGYPPDLLPRGKGGDPTRSGVWLADYCAGEQAAVSILAALYWRDALGGEGQFIEVTAAEALIDILDFDITWYGFNGSIKARTGSWDPNLNQYAWNPCKDGYMMIGGQTDRLWYRIGMCIERDLPQFGRLMGEDPMLKEMAARNALEALTKTYTLTAMWLRDINRIEAETKLMEYEIAAGPLLYLDEVAEFPHFKYRPWVYTIEDEHYGTLLYAYPPDGFQMRTPARVKWLGRPLGKDNGEVYKKYLGLGPVTIGKLKEKGVM